MCTFMCTPELRWKSDDDVWWNLQSTWNKIDISQISWKKICRRSSQTQLETNNRVTVHATLLLCWCYPRNRNEFIFLRECRAPSSRCISKKKSIVKQENEMINSGEEKNDRLRWWVFANHALCLHLAFKSDESKWFSRYENMVGEFFRFSHVSFHSIVTLSYPCTIKKRILNTKILCIWYIWQKILFQNLKLFVNQPKERHLTALIHFIDMTRPRRHIWTALWQVTHQKKTRHIFFSESSHHKRTFSWKKKTQGWKRPVLTWDSMVDICNDKCRARKFFSQGFQLFLS